MIIFLLLTLSLANAAPHSSAPKIPPITYKNQIYTVDTYDLGMGLGVTLSSRTKGNKRENWFASLITITFDPKLKKSDQEIFVTSLKLEHETLIATDTRGHIHRVDAVTGLMPKAYLISGFDDVLRQAENTGLFKAGLKLFEADRTFAGMPELYLLLTNEEKQPRFVLVSAIATWFQRRITDFLSSSRFPTFELQLRNWFTEYSIEKFKMNRIAAQVNSKPDRRFIVIFDNSDASIKLAKRLMAEYPHTIQNVYLREVEKKEHLVGTSVFHTAFDIASIEVLSSRMSIKEAIVVGQALLNETDDELIIPSYAYCPKDYTACIFDTGDLVSTCKLVEGRVRQVCSKR